MTPLTSFLPYVLPHAYGAPDPLAEQAVRNACIELCDESNLVQTVTIQTATAGDPEYAITPPTQQGLSQILAVTFGAYPLRPVAPGDVEHGAAMRAGVEAVDAVLESTRGTPTVYYQTTPTDPNVYLWPVPAETKVGYLAVRAAFVPLRNATQVEDVLFEDWVVEIASGALAQLLAMPGQVFSNPSYAENHAKAFAAGVARAKAKARSAQIPSAMRVRARRFA